jgi:hypothetical protein
MLDATISKRSTELHRQINEVLLGRFGESFQPPTTNEGDESYLRRGIASLQRHSPNNQFSNYDTTPVAILDSTVMPMLIADIRADFEKPTGRLRSYVEIDHAGRKVTRWFGDPHETWAMWSTPPRFARIMEELGKGMYAGGRLARE